MPCGPTANVPHKKKKEKMAKWMRRLTDTLLIQVYMRLDPEDRDPVFSCHVRARDVKNRSVVVYL